MIDSADRHQQCTSTRWLSRLARLVDHVHTAQDQARRQECCAAARPPTTSAAASTAARARARGLGVPFEGTPGAHNAITDVPGLQIGHSTLISSDGPAAVRTGVTAVLPRGPVDSTCFAATFSLNGAHINADFLKVPLELRLPKGAAMHLRMVASLLQEQGR